ncbi:MAG TPA: hypothetical protein VHW09_16165 [Bryobacteraceae bacterium]|jgi:hypothetical protein|nr:hypothetical protein [Bryobacteraceae bacterium]
MAPPRPATGRLLPTSDVQFLLVVAALGLGLYDFLGIGGFGFGHGFEMAAVAQSLAKYGTYANPFQPAITGPTALVPPLFPFLFAALIRILRQPSLVVIAAVCLNIAVDAFIAWLLPRLSVVFYGTHKPGTVSAILWLLSMRLMPQWDLSLTIAGLISFCLLSRIAIRKRGIALTLAAGLVGGLILLANPAIASVIALWMAFLFVSYRTGWRQMLSQGAAMSLVAILCLTPWLVRNYRTWHALILRTSFGITLYSSNNNCASSSMVKERQSGCFQVTHPVDSVQEAQTMRQMGEVAYDRLKKDEAVAWIRSHPARFAQLTAARFVEFWFPAPNAYWFRCYAIWAITLLSLPGIVLMLRHRQQISLFILGVWLVYPPVYYVMVSADRYRYPILWTSLLPAGYFLVWLAERSRAQASASSAPEQDRAVTVLTPLS